MLYSQDVNSLKDPSALPQQYFQLPSYLLPDLDCDPDPQLQGLPIGTVQPRLVLFIKE